jgi:hypothetical protein
MCQSLHPLSWTKRIASLALLLIVVSAGGSGEASAQPHAGAPDDRLFASVGIGLFVPHRQLNDKTGAELDKGFLVGGGLGLELNRFSAIRLSIFRASTEATEKPPSSINGTDFARRFIDVDVLVGRRRRYGAMPYALLGVSRLHSRQDVARDRLTLTSTAVKLGGGFEIRPERSRVAVFGEGAGYIHKTGRKALDRRQVDTVLTAGVRFHF